VAVSTGHIGAAKIHARLSRVGREASDAMPTELPKGRRSAEAARSRNTHT
jgi:hypothetical protein